MPIQWNEDSFYVKELKKFDTPKRDGGYRCNGHEEFPRMLYMAQPHPLSGKYEVAVAKDILSLDKTTVILNAEQFNATCQMEVKDAEMEDKAIRGGWRRSQAEAVAYREAEFERLATEAAHRNYDDRNMGEAAKREIAAAEAATPSQVAEIKEKRRASLAKARAAKAAKRTTTEPAV